MPSRRSFAGILTFVMLAVAGDLHAAQPGKKGSSRAGILKLDGTRAGTPVWSPNGNLLAIPVKKLVNAGGSGLAATPANLRSSTVRWISAIEIWDAPGSRRSKSLSGPDWAGAVELYRPVNGQFQDYVFPAWWNSWGAVPLWRPDSRVLAVCVTRLLDENGKILEPTGENLQQKMKRRSSVVQLWDVPDGRLQKTLGGWDSARVTMLGFSPDYAVLAVGIDLKGQQPRVEFWDIASGKLRNTVAPECRANIAISPNAKIVALWPLTRPSNGKDIPPRQLLDAATGKAVGTLGFQPAASRSAREYAIPPALRFETPAMCFSPDGKTLVTSDAIVWSIPEAKAIRTLQNWHGTFQLAFTDDGKTLLCAGAGITTWDVKSGKPRVRRPAIPTTGAFGIDSIGRFGITWDPKGWFVVVSGWEGRIGQKRTSIKLWNLRSGRLIRAWTAEHALAFAPDGETLADADPDRTVKLWDLSHSRK
jgi:WD40 repeat protein